MEINRGAGKQDEAGKDLPRHAGNILQKDIHPLQSHTVLPW